MEEVSDDEEEEEEEKKEPICWEMREKKLDSRIQELKRKILLESRNRKSHTYTLSIYPEN